MFGRWSSLALLVVAVMRATTAGAQQFGYAPGTTRYRMVVKSNGTSETNGASRPIGLDAQQRLTLTLTQRSRDTLALSIVLDSAAIVVPAVGPIDASSALGLTVTAMLSPRGEIYSRSLPDSTGREAFMSVAEEMARFLPVLPAALRPGLTWTDTTRESVTQLGVPIMRTRVATYTVAGDTTIAEERAWKIERRASTLLEGSGVSMKTPIVFRGSSIGTGAYYLGHSGRYLGALLREEVKSKVTLASLNQDVVGTQTQTTSITLVR